jgi:hypothetical protein
LRARNRVKNKSGFIFAAIVALYLAKCFASALLLQRLKNFGDVGFGWNPVNRTFNPVHKSSLGCRVGENPSGLLKAWVQLFVSSV